MVRPKHFAPPFPKNAPIITIADCIFFVPPRVDSKHFQFPPFPTIFGNDNPIHVEFCSGNGSWIVEKALLFPNINFIAVEKRFDRVKKIWSKIKNHQLKNLLIAFGEGFTISSNFFPSEKIQTIYVNFPDPWPKKKHAKHRIISKKFLDEISRILLPKGQFIFVTDDEAYSSFFLSIQDNPLEQLLPPPGFSSPPDTYGTSFFDSLFRSQGKPIYYHNFQKKDFSC